MQAYNCLEELRTRMPRSNIAYYINSQLIEQVHRAVEVPLKSGELGGVNGYHNSPEEELGEEVEEDVPDFVD